MVQLPVDGPNIKMLSLCLLYRDKRETSSQTEYMLSDIKGRTLCRHPGTVEGQPVTIQKCQVSQLFSVYHNEARLPVALLLLRCTVFVLE